MNGHNPLSLWADLRKTRCWTPLLRDSLIAKSFNLIRCCRASKCTVDIPIHLIVTVPVYCLNVKLQRSVQATRPLHNANGVFPSLHILLQHLYPEALLNNLNILLSQIIEAPTKQTTTTFIQQQSSDWF